ncbi:MAG: hypothetical protein EOP05_09135 [Proteobacteria bacterium]|nr:MAG: hypothetical protein EOP05_09135 [Pseudomonadota bacterium]
MKQERVSNEPPVITKGIQPFSTAFGVFTMQQASVFLWPENISEAEAQALVKKVNSASLEVDYRTSMLTKLGKQTAELEGAWAANECIEKWAVLGPDEDPIFVEWVSEWKTGANEEEQKLIQACVENQAARKTIQTEADSQRATIGQLAEVVNRALDPDSANVQNMKSLRTATSTLEILETDDGVKVKVKLDGFLNEASSVSTEGTSPNTMVLDAKFDIARRLLSFGIPEVTKTGELTGRLYYFLMERTPDFDGRARFTGDIRVYDGEKIVRYGSARFDTVAPK